MKKIKNKFFVFALLVVVTLSFIAFRYVSNGFSWTLRERFYGAFSYDFENQSFMQIHFPANANVFYVVYVPYENNPENSFVFIAKGEYSIANSNLFVFYGEQLGGFESFSIRNPRLDLDVRINGETFRFRGYSSGFTVDLDEWAKFPIVTKSSLTKH